MDKGVESILKTFIVFHYIMLMWLWRLWRKAQRWTIYNWHCEEVKKRELPLALWLASNFFDTDVVTPKGCGCGNKCRHKPEILFALSIVSPSDDYLVSQYVCVCVALSIVVCRREPLPIFVLVPFVIVPETKNVSVRNADSKRVSVDLQWYHIDQVVQFKTDTCVAEQLLRRQRHESSTSNVLA
jgi:hypothetical protein